MVLFLGGGGGSNGSEVLSTGSHDLGALNWDDGTVGVGNETSVSSGVGVRGNGETSSGEVLGTGSLDSGLINGDNGSIGVGNKASGVSKRVVDVVVSIWVSGITGIGVTVVGICVGESVCGKVSSCGSLDLRGLDWGNGTVGVGDKLGAGNSHASEENLE